MTIQEAIRSRKPFRPIGYDVWLIVGETGYIEWSDSDCGAWLAYADNVLADWEVKP